MAGEPLFDAVLTERRLLDHPQVGVLIWWATRFAELGFTPSYGPGDHGNLSCRTEQGCLITARETVKARLTPKDFVEVLGREELSGRPRLLCRGLRLPSTDALVHLRVYDTRPDVRAVLHGHDASTLTKAAELDLPVTTHSAAVPSMALIDDVCQLIRQQDYLLLRDHGFLAVGRSIDEAGELVRRLCSRARSF